MTKEKTIAPKPGDFLPHHLCGRLVKTKDGVSFVFSKKPTVEQLEEMRGALNRLIENPDLIEHLSRIPMGRR